MAQREYNDPSYNNAQWEPLSNDAWRVQNDPAGVGGRGGTGWRAACGIGICRVPRGTAGCPMLRCGGGVCPLRQDRRRARRRVARRRSRAIPLRGLPLPNRRRTGR